MEHITKTTRVVHVHCNLYGIDIVGLGKRYLLWFSHWFLFLTSFSPVVFSPGGSAVPGGTKRDAALVIPRVRWVDGGAGGLFLAMDVFCTFLA